MEIAEQYEINLRGFLVIPQVLDSSAILRFKSLLANVIGSSESGKFSFLACTRIFWN